MPVLLDVSWRKVKAGLKGNLRGSVEGEGRYPALSVRQGSDKQGQSSWFGGVAVSHGSSLLQRCLGFTNKS